MRGDRDHALSLGSTCAKGRALPQMHHHPDRPERPKGELVGVARVDPSIRRGAVSVPHGHEGANVNWLTDADDIDRTTGMAHDSGIPVTLRPAVSA